MSNLSHNVDLKITVYFRRPTLNRKGYISAYSTAAKRTGEWWNRGNDLPDGPWSQNTVDQIKIAIDREFTRQDKLAKFPPEIWEEFIRTINYFMKEENKINLI